MVPEYAIWTVKDNLKSNLQRQSTEQGSFFPWICFFLKLHTLLLLMIYIYIKSISARK